MFQQPTKLVIMSKQEEELYHAYRAKRLKENYRALAELTDKVNRLFPQLIS